MSELIRGAGTPERVWRACATLHRLPELDLAPGELPDTAVVVAPHPDDEVLGAGGTAALLAMLGVRVRFVAVTDGEGSHHGSRTLTPADLARRRRRERRIALERLGLPGADVHQCRLADGDVASREAQLAETVAALLTPDSWCLSTWEGDGHPDHESTGRAAAVAAVSTAVRLLAFPVWAWHWAVPGDPRVPWHRARRVTLGAARTRAKRAAAQAFASQLKPLSDDPADAAVLPPPVLARLLRDFEVFLL